MLLLNAALPSAHILVMYSLEGLVNFNYRIYTDSHVNNHDLGSAAFITDTVTIVQLWKQHLSDMAESSPSWPFNATIECFDTQSNATLVVKYLESRLSNKIMPKVSAIIGPETASIGVPAAAIASKYGLPCILAAVTAYQSGKVERPHELNTSFLIQPPAVYQFRTLIDAYGTSGVKTMVAIAQTATDSRYNVNNCFGATKLAESRGIDVISELTYTTSSTTQDVVDIVHILKNDLKPDAVIWCDWASCAFPENIATFNPMPQFKKANYLPKALSLLDCVDEATASDLDKQGLFQFVSAGQYINEKLSGPDYTEEANPYSSYFRPPLAKQPLTVSPSHVYNQLLLSLILHHMCNAI